MAAIKDIGTCEIQRVVDKQIRGHAQKCRGPAMVRNLVFGKNVAEGTLFSEDLLTSGSGKQIEVDFYRAKLDRLIRAVQEEHDFPEVFIPPSSPTHNPQMNWALMKFLQGRRHVFCVHEQTLVRLGHGFALHLRQRGQRFAGLRIKFIQRMGGGQLELL